MPARFTLEFSSKEIAFFAAAAAFVVVFLVRLHVKVAATGWVGVSLCVCVHSAVEHCSVRWLLRKGWGERSRKRTQLKVTKVTKVV